MDFLLIVFTFTLNPTNGEIQETLVATKPFYTIEECNKMGENIREVMKLPDEMKSVSYCVRKDEFDKELK